MHCTAFCAVALRHLSHCGMSIARRDASSGRCIYIWFRVPERCTGCAESSMRSTRATHANVECVAAVQHAHCELQIRLRGNAMKATTAAMSVVFALLIPVHSHAQYATKPVRIIVPAAA